LLAPADLPQEAASFDLPIALGILAGSEALLPAHLNDAINYRMLDRQLWT
jgi:predicted ATPase with chaperone activity